MALTTLTITPRTDHTLEMNGYRLGIPPLTGHLE